MPPAVAAAGVAVGGSLIGGVLSSRASNRATDAQSQATREARAYQREQDAYERQQHEEQQAQEQAAWEAYERRRAPYRRASASVLARYGIQPEPEPAGGGAPPEGWTQGTPVPAGGPRTLADLGGVSLGSSPTAGMLTPALQAPRRLTLRDFYERA